MGDRYAEERAVWIGRLVRTGRLTRLARRLWMGKNPLRRRADRIEAWITAGLLAAFLVGAPLSWAAVGRWVQQGGLLEQHAQRSWHQVPAVLLRAAPVVPDFDMRTSWDFQVMAVARWAGPGGQRLTGRVPAAPGTLRGRTVQVWVNGSGRPTGSPLLHSELMKRVLGAELLAPAGVAVLLLAVGGLVRLLMDRRRLAGWETGWASIGPRWTRHR
jgi:hypothetical protein